MIWRKLFGVLVFFLIFAGLALANDLTATSSKLNYKQPLKDVPESGLELVGESSQISCGVFDCEYTFKVSNSSIVIGGGGRSGS